MFKRNTVMSSIIAAQKKRDRIIRNINNMINNNVNHILVDCRERELLAVIQLLKK